MNPVYVSTGPHRTVDGSREHPYWWQPHTQCPTRESKGFWIEAAGSTQRQVESKAKVERQAHGFTSTLTLASSSSTSTFTS